MSVAVVIDVVPNVCESLATRLFIPEDIDRLVNSVPAKTLIVKDFSTNLFV